MKEKAADVILRGAGGVRAERLGDFAEKTMWDAELGLSTVGDSTAEGRAARKIFERIGKRAYKETQK